MPIWLYVRRVEWSVWLVRVFLGYVNDKNGVSVFCSSSTDGLPVINATKSGPSMNWVSVYASRKQDHHSEKRNTCPKYASLVLTRRYNRVPCAGCPILG